MSFASSDRGPCWYAKYRLPDGRQVQKKLGPAWTERGRPPAGDPSTCATSVRTAASCNRFAAVLVSLALDAADATDAYRRLRGNADAGHTQAIVPMIEAVADRAGARR